MHLDKHTSPERELDQELRSEGQERVVGIIKLIHSFAQYLLLSSSLWGYKDKQTINSLVSEETGKVHHKIVTCIIPGVET